MNELFFTIRKYQNINILFGLFLLSPLWGMDHRIDLFIAKKHYQLALASRLITRSRQLISYMTELPIFNLKKKKIIVKYLSYICIYVNENIHVKQCWYDILVIIDIQSRQKKSYNCKFYITP